MVYQGMIAETLSINGDHSEPISAYVARPLGPGPFPGMPGYSEIVPLLIVIKLEQYDYLGAAVIASGMATPPH